MSQSGSRSQTPARFNRNAKSDNDLNTSFKTMSNSLSKLCDQYSSANPSPSQQSEKSSFKFADFYAELDNVLKQLPYVDALRFNLDSMERANELLKKHSPNKSDE